MTLCPHGDDPMLCPPCQSSPQLGVVAKAVDPGERTWTGVEAARITGLSYRQVDNADRRGTVSPTVGADGSGTQRGYTLDDLARLRVLHHLYELGLPASGAFPQRLVADLTAASGPVEIVVDLELARQEVLARLRLAHDRSIKLGSYLDCTPIEEAHDREDTSVTPELT